MGFAARLKSLLGSRGDDALKTLPSFSSQPFFLGSTTAPAGSKELLDLYNRNPILRMVSSKVGSLLASVKFRVGVVVSGDLVEIEDHPFTLMLSGRNSTLLGFQQRQIRQVHYDLLGESFSRIVTNPVGMPISLDPINPNRVKEIATEESPFYVVESRSGMREKVPAEEMFYVKDPNPSAPMGRGSGFGLSAGDEIETDEYVSKFINNFYRHGGRPSVIISSEDMTESQKTRLEKKWYDRVSGFGAFRKAFLPFFFRAPSGMEVKELSDKLDKDTLSVRNKQRDIVLQLFGISPEIFGILENSNRATTIEARTIVAENITIPRAEVWKEAYQQRLIPLFDDRLVVWYDDPRPENTEIKIDGISKLPWAFDVDEIRKTVGFPVLSPENGGNMVAVPNKVSLVRRESMLSGTDSDGRE